MRAWKPVMKPPMLTTIDITREVCPMTYVRVKLAVEALEDGAPRGDFARPGATDQRAAQRS